MSKHTAVDLFHDRIMELLRGAKSVNSNTVAIIWIECKAMEREQIIEAVREGYDIDRGLHKWKWVGQTYYEDTYGKEQK